MWMFPNLLLKKEWLPKEFSKFLQSWMFDKISPPNLPERYKMRSGYARLHTMQSCVHVYSCRNTCMLFPSLSASHTLKWGAHLSWMGCNSGTLEPAVTDYIHFIKGRQQELTVALLSGLHLSCPAFCSFSSSHFKPCTCAYVLLLPHPYFFLSSFIHLHSLYTAPLLPVYCDATNISRLCACV